MDLRACGALLLAGICTQALAVPARFHDFGEFVSECSTGSACDGLGENSTVASIDGITFCCEAGNTITISIRHITRRYNESIDVSAISTDDVSGAVWSSDVAFPGGVNVTQSPAPTRVQCECRDVADEVVDEFVEGLRAQLWAAFEATWSRLSNMVL